MKDPTNKWHWRDFTTMPEWDKLISLIREIKDRETGAALDSIHSSTMEQAKYHKGRADGVDAVLVFLANQEKQSRESIKSVTG